MEEVKQFIDIIINVSQAASKDSSRWGLLGVYADVKGSKVRVQATDGHILALQELDVPIFADLNVNQTFFIDAEYISVLKTLQKQKMIIPTLQDNNLIFNDVFKIKPCETQDQKPNDYAAKLGLENLKSSSKEGVIALINVDLLHNLCKALRPRKTIKTQKIKLFQKDENSPIVVRSTSVVGKDDHISYGLIMPMRD